MECKSRQTLIAKVTRKTAEQVSAAIINLLKPLSDWVHILTADNGRECAYHEDIANALNAQFFFAPPMLHGNVV